MSRFLTGVDIIRDGGSIFVAFECDHLLCRCTLAFHIYLPPVDSCDEAQTRRYTHAELREIHDLQWTSKIVGITYDDWFCSKLRVSWTTARQILSELAPQATKLSQYDQNIFAEMVDVANSEGIGWAMATGHAPSKNS